MRGWILFWGGWEGGGQCGCGMSDEKLVVNFFAVLILKNDEEVMFEL